MPLIGVRELRERTAEVMRRVREEKTEYVITHQGRPTALLLPVDEGAVEAAIVWKPASRLSPEGGRDTAGLRNRYARRDRPVARLQISWTKSGGSGRCSPSTRVCTSMP